MQNLRNPLRWLIDVYGRHERIAAPLVFLGGVTYDAITVTRIDRLIENAFIFGYLLILGACIVVVARHKQFNAENHWLSQYDDYFPLVIQFLLGGLLSVYVIFYFRSTSLTVTAVFFLLLVFLMLLNELLHNRLMNLNLLFTLYFFLWFSFCVFSVPIFLGTMGNLVFLLSSLLGLIPAILVLYLSYRGHFQENLQNLVTHATSIIVLYVFIMVFYVMNLIPPVPLALQGGGIYHSVEKQGETYVMKTIRPSLLESMQIFRRHVPWRPGQPMYCYVSIFAPVELETGIRHQWQYYDSDENHWVTTDDLDYRIHGGRQGGYRGYTVKQNLQAGDWRVNVLTENGRLLGRLAFTLEEVDRERTLQFDRITR